MKRKQKSEKKANKTKQRQREERRARVGSGSERVVAVVEEVGGGKKRKRTKKWFDHSLSLFPFEKTKMSGLAAAAARLPPALLVDSYKASHSLLYPHDCEEMQAVRIEFNFLDFRFRLID